MLATNIGPEGKKFAPYVFSLFMFILTANLLGMLPIGIFGLHPFTVTSHFSITGVLAIVSFSIVLIVGFWRHKLRFFTLFVPHGTPWYMIPLIFVVELMSFLVRPFSLGLRLFVAMTARSEEHTSELQSLMRISYAVFRLKKKKIKKNRKEHKHNINKRQTVKQNTQEQHNNHKLNYNK